MTDERTRLRIDDIKRLIAEIRSLLSTRTVDQVEREVVTRAAFERFLEMICEGALRLPAEWKDEHPNIPWQRMTDLGNVLRHAYDRVDLPTIWAIYTDDLDPLERAIDAMLAAHPPEE